MRFSSTDLGNSVFVLNFFPISPVDLTPVSFNWNILIVSMLSLQQASRSLTQISSQFGAVLMLATAYFAVKGRKVYVGPVVYVRKDL